MAENLETYKNRSGDISDKEWLKQLISQKCSNTSEEQAEWEAAEIIQSIEEYDSVLTSLEEACKCGGQRKGGWRASFRKRPLD